MRPLSSETRSNYYGKTSFSNRGFGDGYSDYIKLFQQVEGIDLFLVAKFYNLNISEYNNVIRCPFDFHRDRTPSFHFYKETNSFYCFGCGSGGGPIKFVTLIDNLSREEAIKKLILNFPLNQEIEDVEFIYGEKIRLYFQFSSIIRNFIKHNKNDQEALSLADKMCYIFDQINQKHKGLELSGLQLLINNLATTLHKY